MSNSGISRLYKNIVSLKNSFISTLQKISLPPKSDLERTRAISKNFFLHIHSTRIHKYTLHPAFTMGLGLIAFSLFIILLFTGILLMFYYTPSVEQAYFSVKDITFLVAGGKIIRNMHRWAGHAMIVVVILHIARVFYTSAYTRTRRINWLIGLALLIITILFSFSGYLLPWDQLGYWATTIASNIAASLDELTDALGMTSYFNVGLFIKHIILGANSVGQDALNRFYLLHVVVLPILSIIFIGVHFWRIRKSGGLNLPANADQLVVHTSNMSNQKTEIQKQGHSRKKQNIETILSWPTLLWAELSVFMICLAILMIFSYFLDAPLREIANPAVAENPAKSPWYFLGLQELVSYSAFSGGIAIPSLLLIALILIPFLDKEEKYSGVWFSGKQGQKVAFQSLIFVLLTTVTTVLFTVKAGWLKNWFPEIPQLIIIVINPGTILAFFYAFWSIIVLKKTDSTRMAAIALFTCIFVGFLIFTAVGNWFRGINWEFIY